MIELLVAIAIIGILIALLLPAVQASRGAAARTQCTNQLRQLTLALHHHHDARSHLPAGIFSRAGENHFKQATWIWQLLPFLEQQGLCDESVARYTQAPSPNPIGAHTLLGTELHIVQCPADPLVRGIFTTRGGRQVGMTSYLGVLGRNAKTIDGVLFVDSRIRLGDITDGSSNTLMIGERPPTPDHFYGWWYSGWGQNGTGSLDCVLGINELNLRRDAYGSCFDGPYQFTSGDHDHPCDRFHFWSRHAGGANFAVADGSIRFISYTDAAVLTALATRSGGELASLP